MIERATVGEVPAKHHTILREGGAADGALRYEHCLTRQGFDGAYSILYHRSLPPRDVGHRLSALAPDPHFGPLPASGPDAALHRRHLISSRLYDRESRSGSAVVDRESRSGSAVVDGEQATPEGGAFACDALGTRRLLLGNSDVALGVARPSAAAGRYFANGDGDELYYVHEGRGRVESWFGPLDYRPGDYLLIPRAVVHRFVPAEPTLLFLIEGRSYVDIPKGFRNASGQLRMDAPYCHRDFRRPTELPGAPGPEFAAGGPYPIVVKRGGVYHEILRDRDPLDVVGWDGAVYPVAFSIFDYQAKVGRTHLPPTIFSTFAGGGFLVCSFVPRPVDYDQSAIPCPYPHSSVDCDEVIFYARGNFTSRRGIGPGSLSHHPAGIIHGPQPGAYEASIGKKAVDELAVMIDTFQPLYPTADALRIEDRAYHDSWAL